MKLIQKLARKLHPHLVIPEEVLKHIDSLQKINVVYKTDVVTDRYWRFRDEVSDYMHRYNLWYVTTEVPSLSPLPREYVETTKNVLLQRVLWVRMTKLIIMVQWALWSSEKNGCMLAKTECVQNFSGCQHSRNLMDNTQIGKVKKFGEILKSTSTFFIRMINETQKKEGATPPIFLLSSSSYYYEVLLEK